MESWRPKLKRLIHAEDSWWATAEEEDLANAIVARTVSAGGRLISLTPRKESLEDYFIREVRRD
jgi:hypothetical protein